MNKFYFIILVLIISSCTKKSETEAEQPLNETIISETISSEEFQQKMLATSSVFLLDVRTPQEFASGYIDGATNIDFRASDFKAKLSSLDKESVYFVYCGGGGRSRSAADLMEDLQFKKVYDLAGGFTAWSAKGLPVKQP